MRLEYIRVCDENFEDYFEFLNDKIKNIEVEKEIEKEEMLAKIDEKYAVRLNKFEESLNSISTLKEIEVADEEEQVNQENLGE